MHLPPPIIAKPLPYERQLAQRKLTDIDLVVIHCTELPDLATAREYGERALYDNGSGNSGHYYIDRDGSIQQYIALDRVAHHVRGINPRSIGIELVNRGRWPNWFDSSNQAMSEPYPEAQIAALVRLLEWLPQAVPSLRYIAGHEQLDTTLEPASDDPGRSVQRKLDPGPMFPWELVLRAVDLQQLPD